MCVWVFSAFFLLFVFLSEFNGNTEQTCKEHRIRILKKAKCLKMTLNYFFVLKTFGSLSSAVFLTGVSSSSSSESFRRFWSRFGPTDTLHLRQQREKKNQI